MPEKSFPGDTAVEKEYWRWRALFYAFKWWSVIGILLMSLAVASSFQRLKTNWPATFAHLFANLSFYFLVLAGVLEFL